MATGTDGRTVPQPIPQASHRGAPTPNIIGAVSPPSRRELASWWKKFRKTTEKDEEKENAVPSIFGVPLAESIRYANVAISLTNEEGESFIYGYVPIVVAKCGVFLKEKATDVEGIFRLSGSAKRIKDLQTLFNSPERYGKGLDWTGYTVHDAANILRRYLNQLPEPIVPLDQYERFRDPLRALQQRLEHHPEGEPPPEMTAAEHATAVTSYQKLITELPALNRQLLLYILDLLAVFSSKSDLNRMTAANLAAIFQPGIISHPVHDMAPHEYRLSQDVLIFLIENQDHFLIGMTGTAVDEKTQKAVESGAPSLKSPKTANIGRSASNASAGADSLRKYGIRRNVSVSSHASRERVSPNVSIPGTPASPSYASATGSIGVARSNTVPSKRSPAIPQHRFQRVPDSSVPDSPVAENTHTDPEARVEAPQSRTNDAEPQSSHPASDNIKSSQDDQRRREGEVVPFPDVPTPISSSMTETKSTIQPVPPPTLQVTKSQTVAPAQTRERKISNLFAKSPHFGPSDSPQGQSQKQPKKLQKRQRLPGMMSESAQSSAASLQGDDPFHTPLISPELPHPQTDPVVGQSSTMTNHPTAVSQLEQPRDPIMPSPPQLPDIHGRGSVPHGSPPTSLKSGTSATDRSDFDTLDDPVAKVDKKRNRWRFSSSAKNPDDAVLAPPPPIGQIPGARSSNSSVGSSSRPRHSFTIEPHHVQPVPTDSSSTTQPSVTGQFSNGSSEPSREMAADIEKKSLIGKWKAKLTQSKEERREREAEKERAKSPQRVTGDNSSSRQSLSAIAYEHFAHRGRSFDRPREESVHSTGEQLKGEGKGPMTPQSRIQPTMAGPVHTPAVAPAPALAPALNQVVAPQTASLTASAITPDVPGATLGTDLAMEPPIGVAASLALGNPGPTTLAPTMPTVEESEGLEIRVPANEAPQADSLQHTPTEVKGPILE